MSRIMIPSDLVKAIKKLAPYVVQNGNTTEVGGNVEIDGDAKINGTLDLGNSGDIGATLSNAIATALAGNFTKLYKHEIKAEGSVLADIVIISTDENAYTLSDFILGNINYLSGKVQVSYSHYFGLGVNGNGSDNTITGKYISNSNTITSKTISAENFTDTTTPI